MRAELAKQLGAEGVDGAAFDPPGGIAEAGLEAVRDLAGSFVGERESADPVGRDSLDFDEEADALDQAERLSRAGARENEDRAEPGFDGCAL